jgi:hypothetical protein
MEPCYVLAPHCPCHRHVVMFALTKKPGYAFAPEWEVGAVEVSKAGGPYDAYFVQRFTILTVQKLRAKRITNNNPQP